MSKEIRFDVALRAEVDECDMFVFMDENRAVKEQRVKKVLKSIKENGYIFNPIIVNEKLEIIDGQARCEALKRLKMPIDYIVHEGLTAKDCAILNANTTPWNLKDYIESYMHMDNRNYGYLFHLVNKYELDGIGIAAIVFAINGSVDSQQNVIKNGQFKCTEQEYEDADKLLSYLRRFMPTMKRFQKGRNPLMAIAIMFVYAMELADAEKLLERFNQYYGSDIVPFFNNQETAFKSLNEIYNYHRATKAHFEIEWEKYQTKKNPWYMKKWRNDKHEE